MFVEGIGISSFRSFGDRIQRIGSLSKINLFSSYFQVRFIRVANGLV